MRPSNKDISLFMRMLIAFLAVVILVSGALTLAFYVFSRTSIEQRAAESILQQFRAIEYHFGFEAREDAVKDLHIIASNPVMDDFIMSSIADREIEARSVERLFLGSMKYHKSYEGVYFVDTLGREQVRVDRSGRVRNYRNMSASKLFTRIKAGTPGGVEIFGPWKDTAGRTIVSIGIHKVDHDIGKFGGALIIDWGLDSFIGYLDGIRIFNENLIWLFSREGGLLKQPLTSVKSLDPRPYLSKDVQSVPRLDLVKDGMVVYQDLSVFPGKPLVRLAIGIPSSLLLKDVRVALKFFLLVFLLALLITSIIALYLSRYLSRPITLLAAAATRLAKGDLSSQVAVRASGEVRLLVDSFNQMAVDLEKTTVSRDYVDSIIHSMLDTLIVLNPDGTIKTVNAALIGLLGYKEELVGKHFAIVFPGDSDEAVRLIRVLEKESWVASFETAYLSRTGRRIPVLVSGATIHDKDGVGLGFVLIGKDITDRKKVEESLKRSDEFSRNILDSMNDAISIIDVDNYKIVSVNRVFLEEYGLKEEEVVGKTCYEITHRRHEVCRPPDDPCPLLQTIQTGGHSVVEHLHYLPNNEKHYLEISTFPIKDAAGKVVQVVHVSRNITERKQSEKLIRESEKRYRMLFESADEAIYILEAEGEDAGKILELNKVAAEMHGYTVDELMNKNIREIDTPATAQIAPQLMRRVLSGERIKSHEVTHRRKNGTVFFVEINAGLLELGGHKYILAIDRDITERKIAEYQLLHTKQTLQAILNATPYGVVVMGMDKKIRSANKAALQLMGYDSEEQIVGAICNKSFCPSDDTICPIIDLHETVNQAEKTLITKDGRRVPILKTVVPVEIEGEQVLLEAFIDITDQKNAEQKLQQYAAELKQSNEDVLSFAYIVSHDLRAPLVSIRGFSGELQHALKDIESILDQCMPHLGVQERTQLATTYRKDVSTALDFIKSSVSRMDGLINAILVLSRLGHRELKPEPLNMTDIVKSILSSLAHQIEQRKTVVTVGELPTIIADKLAMEQIMGNLLDNALKYLDPVREGTIAITAEHNGEETVFHVSDNGRGISQEDMHKVFELFRRAGKQDVPGEGMGLAYVKALVRRQGGRIWCESEPGKGTTFNFTIPDPAAGRA